MSDSLSSVWGYLVHLAKLPVLRFSQILLLSLFSSNLSKTFFVESMIIRGNAGYYFLGDLPNLDNLQHFENKSAQKPLAIYLGFIWQKVKQRDKAPGRLVQERVDLWEIQHPFHHSMAHNLFTRCHRL